MMPIRDRLRRIFEERGCPLCGTHAWDFEGVRTVVLVDEDARRRIQRRVELSGARNTPESTIQKRLYEEASRNNRLIKLACDNCGHTELLDAGKLAG